MRFRQSKFVNPSFSWFLVALNISGSHLGLPVFFDSLVPACLMTVEDIAGVAIMSCLDVATVLYVHCCAVITFGHISACSPRFKSEHPDVLSRYITVRIVVSMPVRPQCKCGRVCFYVVCALNSFSMSLALAHRPIVYRHTLYPNVASHV